MSSNVGLSTPRGSGTSGYVQRNLSHLKPRDPRPTHNPAEYASHIPRAPDPAILEHERKRKIEVSCLELRDELEEEGKLDEDAIDEKVDKLRAKLSKESESASASTVKRGEKLTTHEGARAKELESERVRKALGIGRDYVEGSHWKRQEERRAAAIKQEEGGEADEKARGGERERRRERDGQDERERRRDRYRDRDGERYEDRRSPSRSRSPVRDD
ncbi:cwf21-domain-containing protein [Microthyrium microscopicum]|uniref:Cwf21-domain-containing protein n=1 Tax=Microthyrium microscopicum TaxID=703497 RepID=A0A6A6TZU9_9PEZI|nr:cwf21-domain-containing protein [Microthyrium microscopicum]